MTHRNMKVSDLSTNLSVDISSISKLLYREKLINLYLMFDLIEKFQHIY